MKNKKIFLYVLIPAALGAGLLAVNIASAQGWLGGFNSLTPDQIATRQQTMFQNEAQALGVSVDDVKNYWAQGKTMQQLMTDKGISQTTVQTNMKNLRLTELKTQLQTLVDKGIITQAQSDQRLQFMQNQQTTGTGMGHRGRGFRGGFFL